MQWATVHSQGSVSIFGQVHNADDSRRDNMKLVHVELSYSILHSYDVIARSARILNQGGKISWWKVQLVYIWSFGEASLI